MKVYAPQYFDALLVLLRRGTGKTDASADPDIFNGFDYSYWRGVFEMAALHAVTGIASDGCEGLEIPPQLAIDLAPELDEIENGNADVDRVGKKLTAALESAGLHPLVYKGVSLFKYYPNPAHRCPGDVDILIIRPEEFIDGGEALSKLGATLTKESDGCLETTVDGVCVELHPYYYDCAKQDIVEPGTPQGELLMLSSHILKHVLGNGVQLKQLCDYAMARKANGGLAMGISKEAGIKKWQKVLDAFVDCYLLNDGSPKALIMAQPLYKRLKAYSRDTADESRLTTALHLLSSLPFGLRYAPAFWLHTVTTLLSHFCTKKSL